MGWSHRIDRRQTASWGHSNIGGITLNITFTDLWPLDRDTNHNKNRTDIPCKTDNIRWRQIFVALLKQLTLYIRLYWKRVIAQYRGWIVVFQICTMYTAFLDKEIFHQSPGRRSRWHWLHPLKCLCCSWCCAADLVLLCTKLRSCSSRQQSDTTDKYADQNRNLT